MFMNVNVIMNGWVDGQIDRQIQAGRQGLMGKRWSAFFVFK
jgi:hypothetical protein